MLLQPKGNTNPADRFHVPPGIGKALLLTGVVEEYVDYSKVIANTAAPVRWTVSREDSGRPMIQAICSTCAHNGQQGNQIFLNIHGKAHENVFTCFHWSEKPPRDVVAIYLAEWKRWTKTMVTERPKFYATR